ncbi:hypothetical protein QQS21_007519 [Conoideocrella luteorostrata]|uniref:AB hydrolase-1 domain-containing protein n=1 Tax=Conoideocrella luteorostrata TaxID=1105319 RepID=A0AAJ0CNF3_9HYPO|nr:hypothetical protein QQS21_007519 [Conoideocrella luteorostrata]
MFDNFAPFSITTQDNPPVLIKGLQSPPSNPPLPPLLLLHGFPQTRHIWHRLAPRLADKYTLVLPDIRGYGESSKPPSVEAFVKSIMAKDMITLMETLGHRTFFVCAHDRGARIAHKMLVDHPDRVKRAILLDICPTLAMYEGTTQAFATAYFHWFFLIQPYPLPETLISAAPRKFAELYMRGHGGGGDDDDQTSIFNSECFETYARMFEDPDTVHAMCNDYRAAATLDLDQQRDDITHGRLIKSPVRVLWGKKGVVEECFEPVKEWKAVAEKDVSVDGYAVDSGHYIPEEAPGDVVSAVLEFLV